MFNSLGISATFGKTLSPRLSSETLHYERCNSALMMMMMMIKLWPIHEILSVLLSRPTRNAPVYDSCHSVRSETLATRKTQLSRTNKQKQERKKHQEKYFFSVFFSLTKIIFTFTPPYWHITSENFQIQFMDPRISTKHILIAIILKINISATKYIHRWHFRHFSAWIRLHTKM